MIIPSVDDLVITDDSGECLEEVDRKILYQGAWCTAFFIIQSRSNEADPWQGPLVWIHRYQKVQEGWKLVSKIHLTSTEQVKTLVGLLNSNIVP